MPEHKLLFYSTLFTQENAKFLFASFISSLGISGTFQSEALVMPLLFCIPVQRNRLGEEGRKIIYLSPTRLP